MLASILLPFAACPAKADFDGPYSLTPPNPGNYSYSGFPPRSFGDWTASGANSVVDTLNAPAQLYLQVPSAYFFPQELQFSTHALADGMVVFDATAVSSFMGDVSWFKQAAGGNPTLVPLDAGPSGLPLHYSIKVLAGDQFGFLLLSGADVILPGQPPCHSLTVSGFSAPVPEPGSGALLAASAALLFAWSRRR